MTSEPMRSVSTFLKQIKSNHEPQNISGEHMWKHLLERSTEQVETYHLAPYTKCFPGKGPCLTIRCQKCTILSRVWSWHNCVDLPDVSTSVLHLFKQNYWREAENKTCVKWKFFYTRMLCHQSNLISQLIEKSLIQCFREEDLCRRTNSAPSF